MVHWAGSLKDQGRRASTWVAAGTAALVVLNAGVSLFGQGVVESVLYQLREKPQPDALVNERTEQGESNE